MVLEINPISNFCPECGGATLSNPERGETVCRQCGLIIGDRGIDITHSGIRAYTKQEIDNKRRTGTPISILLPDIGLSTVINKKNIKNPDLKRAVKWNTHLKWDKRNLLIAITEIKRIGTNLNFPERIKKGAVRLYKKAYKNQLLRGRSINGMVSACIYYTCKKENMPITFQEILNEASINSKSVKKCYKILVRELNLKPPCINPILLIPRYCAELKLSVSVEKESIRILKRHISKNFTCGKDPKGLCAGVIYLVAKAIDIKISQKEISKIVGVTEVTLRSRYKDLLMSLNHSYKPILKKFV